MAMWDGFQAQSLGATALIIVKGASNALFFQPVQGQVWFWLKWISGGSVEILPCGQSLAAYASQCNTYYALPGATAAAIQGTGYQIDTTGATGPTTFQMYGQPYFMLCTNGATAIVHALFGKSAGF